jgi:hypothetical protein
VLLASGAGAALLPPPLRARLARGGRRRALGPGLVAAAGALVLGGIAAGGGFSASLLPPLHRPGTALGAVEAWARTRTPVDAVFAIPPSWSGFRSHAHRAVAINFKAFPYRDRTAPVWFERLLDWAPIDLPARGRPDLQARLDSAYGALPAPALARLARRYGVAYVVRGTPLAPASPAFSLAFASGPWTVYRVLDAPQPGRE